MSEIRFLEDRVRERIRSVGWERLTPIQRLAFPVILRRRDALLVAPTGSGKTEAAIIPIFTALARERPVSRGVRMMYITPLRALNRDILRRIISYAEAEDLNVAVRHGDTSTSARQKMIEKPPDILITTPETLAILLASRRMKLNLRSLRWVVVDEVHELIGSERGAHICISLERLKRLCKRDFVRVGLSATLGNLSEAAKFLVGVDRRCAVLVDSSIRRYDITCSYVDGSLADVAESITHYLEDMGSGKSILLFTNTRDEAEYIGALLKAKSPEIPVEVHHGSLSREIREDTEAKLRDGEAGIVVSTSSLELGIDIGSIAIVIQLGSPRQAVKLVQRVGRSRHRVGEVAKGFIVTNRLDEELESLALIRRVEEKNLEANSIHLKPLDVLAHHLVGLALETDSYSLEEAIELVSKAYPFRDVTVEDIDSCLLLLERQGIVRYDGEIVRRRGPKTYRYYYENISMIPDIQQFNVFDFSSKKTIGRLDQMFVGEYGEPGKPFVLKGSSWKIVSVDDSRQVVNVEPMFKDIATVPYWIGELIPVDLETAKLVGRLRRLVIDGVVHVDARQKKRIYDSREKLGLIPDDQNIVIEKKRGFNTLIVHACLGTKANQTLATLLSTLISSMTGYLVEARSDPYRILLSSQGILNISHVFEALKKDFDLEEVLSASVVGTHPLNWKTWYVSKRFGIIDRGAQYDRRASRLIQERYRGTALYKEVLRELFFEKYDLEKAKDILSSIRDGRVRLVGKELDKFTSLARPILEYASSFAALPLSVEKAVIDLVKERLKNGRHRLVCLSCGRWESVIKVKDLIEPIRCPLCRSRLIGETFSSDYELIKIVKKKRANKPLSRDEEARFRRAWKSSSLIQNFGRRALIALSGFGVGADTAARILKRSIDEDEFYRNIYRAEKTFVTTRGFWSD